MASFAFPIVFTHPTQVNAGFFSFLDTIFNKTDSAQNNRENSQNVALLQAALNHDPNPSKGGGDITIVDGSALWPESGPLGTIADIQENTPKSDQISVYVVRERDSLSGIAKMFNVSVNTIIWANDIKRGDTISVGQELLILPISGVRHTVEKGETLQSITKKYKGSLEEIRSFNGLNEDTVLVVGDVVVIPDGEIAAPKNTSASYKMPIRGAGGPEYNGYYIRPTTGVLTQGLHGYNGIDLGAPTGTPIFAAASGDVIISRDYGWNGGYGNYIVIQHDNGTQTLYGHTSSNIVKAGWHVVQGQIIGYVGSTGRSTGPHLHFEVRGAKNPFVN
ncbi:MAG: peptidoglycan DD-metalloendopeptidase family protein [Candidatus Lloydbacteria bacterium]|nr:peptidoglycan DD-metalloendopeptidase family protein [Candidatus Lloydbacteria bacterium]